MFEFIKKLSLSPRFIWKKDVDGDETVIKSKQKTKHGDNYLAKRDIVFQQAPDKEDRPPFVFFDSGVSSNGVIMQFAAARIHNLSDKPVFIESIEARGIVYRMRDKLVKPGETASVHSIGSMPILDKNDPIYFDMIYRDIDGKKFKARHDTELRHMAIDKYKIERIFKPAHIDTITQ